MPSARFAFVCAVVAWSSQAIASQVRFRGLEEDAPGVQILLAVKIVSVEPGQTLTKFPKRPDGVATAVHKDYIAEVREVILGECKATRIHFRHTMVIPVKYDAQGNVEFTYSLSVPGSGIEHTLKAGTEYVIGFSGFNVETSTAYLLRAEPAERRAVFVAATAEAAAWRTAKAKLATALDTAMAAAFDPASNRLCLVLPRAGGTDVFVADAKSIRRLQLAVPRRFNRIDFVADKVRLRLNDGEATLLRLAEFVE